MSTRWLCVVALALDARSVLLSIKEPADGACVLSTSAAVAEVFVERGDVLGLLADLDVASFDYCNLNFAVWGTHEDPERRLLYDDTHRPWLEAHLGPLPPLLFDRCCAQFLVTRDRVRARPRAFYEAALAHAYYDVEPLPEGDKEANRQIGLLFEWLWHHIFGEPPVDPDVADIVPDIEETDIVYLSGDRRRPRCAPRPGRPRA